MSDLFLLIAGLPGTYHPRIIAHTVEILPVGANYTPLMLQFLKENNIIYDWSENKNICSADLVDDILVADDIPSQN